MKRLRAIVRYDGAQWEVNVKLAQDSFICIGVLPSHITADALIEWFNAQPEDLQNELVENGIPPMAIGM